MDTRGSASLEPNPHHPGATSPCLSSLTEFLSQVQLPFRSVQPQGKGVGHKGGKIMRQEKAPNPSPVHLALRLKSEGRSPKLQTS